MKIAYYADFYATQRLVIGKVTKAQYVRLFAFSRFLFALCDILKKLGFYSYKWYFYFSNTCFGFLGKNIDCIHFFNQIVLNNSVNWISQFETGLPRYKTPTLRAIKAIANKNCKAILPLSRCAYNIELGILEHFPKYKNEVIKKMFVLHPPQKLLVNDILGRSINDKLTFVFVGNDFFRKGGIEMLTAFEKAIANYKNESQFNVNCLSGGYSLTIISQMYIGDYVTHSTEIHKKQALDFFKKNSAWIKFHNGLPNDKVLEIIRKSDIGLLPTKDDTYGYSVLEMQASGIPVISTDIMALPEINNNECGWLIPVTKNKFGKAFFQTEEERANLCREIENGLYSILVDIFSEYAVNGLSFVCKRAKKCLERIAREHNPVIYEKILDKIISDRDSKV